MDSVVNAYHPTHFGSHTLASPTSPRHAAAQLLPLRHPSTAKAAAQQQDCWRKVTDLGKRQRYGKLERMATESSSPNAVFYRRCILRMPVSWAFPGYGGVQLLFLLLPHATRRRWQQQQQEEEEEDEELNPKNAASGDGEDNEDLAKLFSHAFDEPEELRNRIRERLQKKGKDILQPKTGSVTPLSVSFGISYDPTDGYIWLELYDAPSDNEIDIIGSVIRSWFILGRLGGFNSLNIQLTEIPVNKSLVYNHEREEDPMPAIFENISDLEFQSKTGRFWVDMGTSDPLAMDILINALKEVSSDHVGIKQLTFGGDNLGGWQEGLVSEEHGYRVYKM